MQFNVEVDFFTIHRSKAPFMSQKSTLERKETVLSFDQYSSSVFPQSGPNRHCFSIWSHFKFSLIS